MNSEKSKLLVGLTGGIGAGKSIVAKVFKNLGVGVYNSDSRAKELMQSNEDLRRDLILNFSEEAFKDNGELNRSFLANLVFKDKKALSKINALVHPRLRKDFFVWAEKQSSAYVIMESAILFETGLNQVFHKIICVCANDELRITRVMTRDNISRESVLERFKNQLSQEDKRLKSDYVIWNENTLLVPKILDIHKEIQKNL